MKMNITIEKVLADAHNLVTRLKEHDNAADGLIAQTQQLNKRVDAMCKYEEDLTALNELARHKPRATMLVGIAAENLQLKQLTADNNNLRLSLDEHQVALQLIMSKYRSQVANLLLANSLEQKFNDAVTAVTPSSVREGLVRDNSQSTISEAQTRRLLANITQIGEGESRHIEKIMEMVAVMQKAAAADDENNESLQRRLAQLRTENQTLRRLVNMANSSCRYHGLPVDAETQTDTQTQTVDDKKSLLEISTDDIKIESISASCETSHLSPVSNPFNESNCDTIKKGTSQTSNVSVSDSDTDLAVISNKGISECVQSSNKTSEPNLKYNESTDTS